MRKLYLFAIVSLCLGFVSHAQVSYSGNGNTGFGNGGELGNNTLSLSDNGTTITFDFASAVSGNNIVVYIDSKSGGFANTTSFDDDADGGRSATSTYNWGNDPEVTFPAGFTADYAVVVGSSFAVLFELSETGSHSATGLTYTSGDTSVTFAQLGMTATDKFDFVAIFNSDTSYISNEVIGGTSSIVTDGGGTNPGFTGSITFNESRSYPNTWIGGSGTGWTTAANWTEGAPDSDDYVYIPSGTSNYPTASSATTVGNVVIKSGASLIATSTFSGTIKYERSLATDNWYLVSSPVSGETIEDMISNHTFASGTGSNIGLAPYDNSQASASDRWAYLTSSATGTWTSGIGYAVKLASAGNLVFEGTMPVSDVDVSLTDNSGGSGNAFNLVGNPYPSFIAANSNADGTNNILTRNSGDLTETTLWFWNQGTSSYDQINQASSSFFVAPGQGFFVSASGAQTFELREAFQSHETTDTFQRQTATRPEVRLIMTDGTQTRDAEIYYIDGTTTGFDNGYDSSIFGGVTQQFAVYTEAVANGTGKKLGIQSLPNIDLDNMIIPVGMIADAGTLTFSVEDMNLPSGYKVFLEDKDNGNFIRLDEDGTKHEVALSSSVNGIGRFFLHVTTNALSSGSVDLSNISAYLSDSRNLRVVGIMQGTTQVKLFNILGKQVFNTAIQSAGADDIPLPSLRQGVYILQITSEEGSINKKLVI